MLSWPVVLWQRLQSFRRVAGQRTSRMLLNAPISVLQLGVAGDEWLFAASLGKRSGKFLLSLASDILQYVAAGLSGDERVCMSRLCRGYTTQDYKIFKARDTGIEIGLSDGGSHVVSSNSFWSLLRWML